MEKDLILERLIKNVKAADQRFQEAEDDSVNLAIYELMCAEENLNLHLEKCRRRSEQRLKKLKLGGIK